MRNCSTRPLRMRDLHGAITTRPMTLLHFSSERERIRLEAAVPGKCNDTSEHANLMGAYLLLECYSYTGIAVLNKCFVDYERICVYVLEESLAIGKVEPYTYI